jgi:peptide deformylase
VPDLRGSLPRHLAVRVRYLDREGGEQEEEKRGLTAGTFQHEVDHLDGVLFVDRADPRTLSTWEQFDRRQRAQFEERARAIVERAGS